MTYKLTNIFDLTEFHKAFQVVKDFFTPTPVTPSQMVSLRQDTIEDCAKYLGREIAKCNTLTELYEVTDAVRYFRTAWQDDVQAGAWYDSLMLETTNRGLIICRKY